MFDGKQFGEQVVDLCRTFVLRSLEPVQSKLAEIEAAILNVRAEKGDRGDQGPQGPAGKDAAAVDYARIEQIVAERVKAAVEALPKPKDGADGKDGRDGKDGEPGPRGEKGLDGIAGKDGAAGRDGKDGVDGIIGKDGAPGKDGRDGRDGNDGRDGDVGIQGKDGAEIEPLDGMDESATYQRGTWVTHRNGLWRAFRMTDPVKDGDYKAAGWQAVVPGVFDIRGSLAGDNRTYMQTVELSDGKAIVSKTKIPTLQHRGVFREGLTYERGDFVQWGGNLWHANEATTDKPIEGSKTWTLSARRGRDGKDPGDRTT
jgi:hypothetical protein